MAWTDYDSEDYAGPLTPRKFRNYGPMDFSPYAPAVNPNIATQPSINGGDFNEPSPISPRPIALAPRQPGGMGARNPQADLLDQRTDIGEKLRAAYQPNPINFPRALLGALVSNRNPQLGNLITGDYQRQRAIQPLLSQQKALDDQIEMGRQYQNDTVSNAEKQAATGFYQAHANAITNPPMRPKEESWSIVPSVTGPNGELIEREQNSGQTRYADLPGGAKPLREVTQTDEDKAISDHLGAQGKPNTQANRDKARSELKTRDRKPVDQELTDINKQLKEAQLAKAQEPTADEQRRADLARNMNENLDQLEEIANRRPDLFGPVAGRMTQAANVIGTSDPDKAKLKAIREYLGMASVGAHAMRNAQHVGTAADAVMNGFTNSPAAMKAAIGEARKSTGTFLADEQRRKNRAVAIGTGGATPAQSAAGTIIKYDTEGNRVP